MDLIKIGKFIADKRREKNITQDELAQKLYITDRAVSKWERGLSLPDVDKMLDLCNILGININELLIGEEINMEDYEKKTEELLLEMAKQEEVKNKKLLTSMWVIAVVSILFYFGVILLASYALKEGFILGTIIVVSTILLAFSLFYAFKLEVDAGYYECNNCKHKFIPSYFSAFITPHLGTTRYLKCPKCNKRSWSKKVMTKN